MRSSVKEFIDRVARATNNSDKELIGREWSCHAPLVRLENGIRRAVARYTCLDLGLQRYAYIKHDKSLHPLRVGALRPLTHVGFAACQESLRWVCVYRIVLSYKYGHRSSWRTSCSIVAALFGKHTICDCLSRNTMFNSPLKSNVFKHDVFRWKHCKYWTSRTTHQLFRNLPVMSWGGWFLVWGRLATARVVASSMFCQGTAPWQSIMWAPRAADTI